MMFLYLQTFGFADHINSGAKFTDTVHPIGPISLGYIYLLRQQNDIHCTIYGQHFVVVMPRLSVVYIYLANDLDQVDLSIQLPKKESHHNLFNLQNTQELYL